MCLDTVKQVLFNPTKFFHSLAKRKNYKLGDALRFLLLAGVFYTVMALVVELVLGVVGVSVQGMFGTQADRMMAPFVAGFRSAFAIVGAVFSYISLIIGSFVSALIIWMWIAIWGGKGDYQKAYSFTIYTMTPWLILGWLPIINLLAVIWQLVLMIRATPVMYTISPTRSAVMWILPVVLLMLLVGALVGMGVLMALFLTLQ